MGFFVFGRGIFFGLATLCSAAASRCVPFPRWGGFKRKEYVLEKDFFAIKAP
jgi:hypothetical protein